VPLSEHEQRLLEQIERALYAEDPKFASTVSSTNLRTHARRQVRRAVVGFVLGLLALLVGVVIQSVPLAVAAFLLMFGAGVYGMSQVKRLLGKADLKVINEQGKPRRARRPSPMKRMEERFRRRFDED
jgi:hypothetical protein